MKSFVTMSDAGSVAIGTKDAWFLVPNGYGDGETSVLVFDEYQEWNDFSEFSCRRRPQGTVRHHIAYRAERAACVL